MPCPISITKFVGTISLGLLTGTSYTLTTITLPSLALLPSASLAARTLATIQTRSTRHILTLASISSLSLITAFTLASPRGRHPYLLWTALVSFLGGQGVEYWYNGLSRFPSLSARSSRSKASDARGTSPGGSDSGYIEVEASGSEDQVNGEKVEMEMSRERKVQKVRTWIAGVGFAMGVVGIWGDGA
ncbi:hypothetical protein LTR99_008460 [Exophiala xenobiotica]|uniref:DUF4203 domain-containing protein n=1 Tax=Vermiconidia calcicola TaxID=1690605 RepID=A0AAV9Q2Q9_9PEZI|nr:hypothetical protein H2202_004483 [Exophiala xenobiotica]KAK5532850.1 hypothetical protein LTR25_007554 [Vermiconidia calcicola]KAK5546579.1 hypothetical protein LTR23_003326 [Chaetothyriales sp. CCFEE 6169]KAK5191810.1 hypothetical protein LTR92_008391 [Exophiala xenobiotica]KAK5211377.1 hypothetical protein LTR41_002837 [Exophiala xenobiotica]